MAHRDFTLTFKGEGIIEKFRFNLPTFTNKPTCLV